MTETALFTRKYLVLRVGMKKCWCQVKINNRLRKCSSSSLQQQGFISLLNLPHRFSERSCSASTQRLPATCIRSFHLVKGRHTYRYRPLCLPVKKLKAYYVMNMRICVFANVIIVIFSGTLLRTFIATRATQKPWYCSTCHYRQR